MFVPCQSSCRAGDIRATKAIRCTNKIGCADKGGASVESRELGALFLSKQSGLADLEYCAFRISLRSPQAICNVVKPSTPFIAQWTRLCAHWDLAGPDMLHPVIAAIGTLFVRYLPTQTTAQYPLALPCLAPA